jgi:RimJ/RimL family protein N-acetyltransferase
MITQLHDPDRPLILRHLLALNREDRYLRFFASLGDYAITHYVNNVLDMHAGRAYGAVVDGKLVGFAHISSIIPAGEHIMAEFAVSVDRDQRGAGLASQLLERAIEYAKEEGINTLFMSCLRENKAMQHIARKAGLNVVVNADEAYADLTTTPKSVISVYDKTELLDEDLSNIALGLI